MHLIIAKLNITKLKLAPKHVYKQKVGWFHFQHWFNLETSFSGKLAKSWNSKQLWQSTNPFLWEQGKLEAGNKMLHWWSDKNTETI